MANRWGNVEPSDRFCLLGFQKSLWTVTTAMNENTFASWKKSYDKYIQNIKKQRHHFANKGPYSESYGFSSSHVRMWELNQNWTIMKAEHQRTDAFNSWCWRRLESPLDCKEIKPVHPKENQPWIFIGRAVAEVLVLWPPDLKSWLTGKDLDAGKDWRQEEKGTAED